MNILALDPSINYLGWVLMSKGAVHCFGTIKSPAEFKGGNLVERIGWMLDALDDLPSIFSFSMLALEKPESWGAYKSMASSRSGSLLILEILVGALTAWAISKVGVENVRLVKVSEHKGQLPKLITQRRMQQKYNCKFKTDHEADACSVGDYILTKEHNETNST